MVARRRLPRADAAGVQTQVTGSPWASPGAPCREPPAISCRCRPTPGGAPADSQTFPAAQTSVSYRRRSARARTTYGCWRPTRAAPPAISADATIVVVNTGGHIGAAHPESPGADAAQLPSAAQPLGGGRRDGAPLSQRTARLVRQQHLAVPPGRAAAPRGHTLGAQLEARQRRRHVAGRGDLQLRAEADEGTLLVHVVDVIGGHCGGNPSGRVDRSDGAVVRPARSGRSSRTCSAGFPQPQ